MAATSTQPDAANGDKGLRRTRFVGRTFLKGLAVILPIAATVYVVLWIVGDLEALLRRAIVRILPEAWYVPGFGVAVAVAGIFVVGLLMYPWLTRKTLESLDQLFRRLPLAGSVYGPVRDLMNVFSGDVVERLNAVVMVRVPNTDMETLGFITREDNAGLPEGMVKDGHVVVFVQWSSQIGGYCFIVPRDSVRPVNISIQDGLRWAITAGISGPYNHNDR